MVNILITNNEYALMKAVAHQPVAVACSRKKTFVDLELTTPHGSDSWVRNIRNQ